MTDLIDPHAPIPRWPDTLDELMLDRMHAIERYRDLVQRLTPGALVALSDVVGAELARRSKDLRYRDGQMPGQRIGR